MKENVCILVAETYFCMHFTKIWSSTTVFNIDYKKCFCNKSSY